MENDLYKKYGEILLKQKEAYLYDWLYYKPPIFTNKIPTMGVNDKKQLFINPDFKITDEELVGCLYHENLHLVYKHYEAKGDKYLVNVASDIFINEQLTSINYKLPKGALFKKTFEVPDEINTCQEIYDWLEENLDSETKDNLESQFNDEEQEINSDENSASEPEKILDKLFDDIQKKIYDKLNKTEETDLSKSLKWDLDLEHEIGRLIKREYINNYKRPARVEISGTIRPHFTKNINIPLIHVYIDTSGSMNNTLGIVVKSLLNIKRRLTHYRPKYFGFNTSLYDVKADELESLQAEGGTEFNDVKEGADLHIIITDGELDFNYIDSRKDIIVYLCNGEKIERRCNL